ncbi:MAG: thioesterase family protein [Verrucomicrobiota bacterium]
MAHQFSFRRRVEFADTDLAGIMHFSNFFRFMESAEHAFYRDLGFSVHPFNDFVEGEGPQVGWPRVQASADYRLPLHFEEEVEIELLVEELRSKTVRYFFQFWKNPDNPEARVVAAIGRLTVVCVSFDPETRRMKAVAIPEEVRQLISVAPEGTIPDVIPR